MQVQFQLQQSLGGVAVAPTLGRPSSKSPTRRSPTKHRPFQLSSSNWRSLPADSAPMGKSQAVPSAERQPASPKKARSPSKSPIRTASSPQKQPAGARKKAASSSAKGTSHVERQAERQNRGIEGQGDGASQSTHDADVMGFGTYGGVAFSSFVPARPASSLDAAQGLDLQEDDEGSAVMQKIAQAYVGALAQNHTTVLRAWWSELSAMNTAFSIITQTLTSYRTQCSMLCGTMPALFKCC